MPLRTCYVLVVPPAGRAHAYSQGPGLYLSSEEATAASFADASFRSGRGGGPAVVKISMPTEQFTSFIARTGATVDRPIPVPLAPGQLETFIPMADLPAFNNVPGIGFKLAE